MSHEHDTPEAGVPGAGSAALVLAVVSLVLALAVIGLGSLFG